MGPRREPILKIGRAVPTHGDGNCGHLRDNTGVRIVPGKSWHTRLIKLPDDYDVEMFNAIDLQPMVEGSYGSLTILAGSEICCIMGLMPVMPGVAEAWFIPSRFLKQNVRQSVKILRNFLELGCRTWNLHRVQATALESSRTNQRFLEWLGFEYEGRLRQYDLLKQNYYRYSFLWPKSQSQSSD